MKNSLILLPTDMVELYKTIRTLSSKKSVDLHGFSNNMLKIVAEEISEVLSYTLLISPLKKEFFLIY